ncbi:Molybdenum cofactor biosynthesis protein MoaA [Bacillus thermotolerans]|nr:Molybdenum cofactor biosynthesis protein MoaA [Bacillus thermotolerans]
MPEEIFGHDYMFLSKKEILSFEEIERLVSLMASFGVKKVRITGGEPLMRKDLSKLIFSLKKIDGIKDVALTTNGSLLRKYAQALIECSGLRLSDRIDYAAE